MKEKFGPRGACAVPSFACAGGVVAVVVHGHRRADALGRAAGRAGPGAAGCRGQCFLAPAAKLAHAPATGGAFVGHTAVFHHVLEHLRHRVPPGAGTGAGGRARGMGVFPAAVLRAAGAVHAVHRSDADALSGHDGFGLSGGGRNGHHGYVLGHHPAGCIQYISGIYHSKGFDAVPIALLEAASIDGAGPLRTFSISACRWVCRASFRRRYWAFSKRGTPLNSL